MLSYIITFFQVIFWGGALVFAFLLVSGSEVQVKDAVFGRQCNLVERTLDQKLFSHYTSSIPAAFG